MRSLLTSTVITAVSASLLDAPFIGSMTCGSCGMRQNADGLWTCNTGKNQTKIPLSAEHDGAAGLAGEHGVSTATAMSIDQMKDIVGNQWPIMFCASYLNGYKDGTATQPPYDIPTAPGSGSACVRGQTRNDILEADREAREHYIKFGTENGYPSSYAMSKDEPVSPNFEKWGTGGEGDVPANWCSVYMKNMLCAVAFPQVALSRTALDSLRGPLRNSIVLAKGEIRPVEFDDCKKVFRSCNRRQPWDYETAGGNQPPELQGAQSLWFDGTNEQKIENDAYCLMWGRGYGLARAGNAIGEGTEFQTVRFESAGLVTASPFLVFGALLSIILVIV